MNWQPIESLGTDDHVLLYSPLDGVTYGWFDVETGGFQDWTTDFMIDKPTHWMPLPEPPE